jgi:tetratricopeptide (TPR) repeat protein
MLGALAWKQGNCPGAVEHFGQAKPAIASQPDALREYGGCLLRLRKPDEAIVVLRDLAALRPEDAHARYLLALALMDATRFRDAIEALAPLAAGARPDAVALELTANAHEALGETPRAVELLREAMLLEPHRLDLYLDFASLAFAHQSFQVGIDVIDAGLTQLPDSAQLYLARGVLHVQLGEYPEADSDFDKAERLDPARAMGSVARSLAQVQQNNLDDALATVRAQLKMNSKDPVAHYVLADLLSRQGAAPGSPEFAQAVAAAQEAVRLRPDFFLARDILSRLYLEAGEKDKAIEQCRLALRDNPSDEIALYRLIRALQASGRADVKAEVPELLKRFNAAREETQKRQARESQYRLIEAK